MPQLLPDGFPERSRRSRFDFSQWADGQAWRFLKGEDYTSTTDSFRYSVKRWAAANGYKAETCPLPATDDRGRPLPATKADPAGLAIRFVQLSDTARRSRGSSQAIALEAGEAVRAA